MTWWKASSVTVTAGQSTVAVNTGDDVGIIKGAEGLVIGNQPPVEIKRSYLNGSVKTLELVVPWPYANQSGQPAVAFPTDGDLAEATKILRSVGNDAVTFAEKLSAILTSTTPTIPIETEAAGTLNVVPYAYLVNLFNTLLSGFGDFGQPLYQTDSKNEARTILGLAPQLVSQPALKMDFVNNQYSIYEPFGLSHKILTDILTTTRASTATYSSQNVLATAAVNVPRIQFNAAGKCEGLIVEGQKTNYAIQSRNFLTTPWVQGVVAIASDAAESAKFGAPVFSISGATAVGFSDANLRCSTFNLPTSTELVYSIWVKPSTQCNKITLRSNSDALGLSTASYIRDVIPNVWQLISAPAASSSGGITTTISSASANVPGSQFFATEFKFEVGNAPSSDIPTSGAAVTRNADLCVVSSEIVSSRINAAEGTIYCAFKVPPYADFNTAFGAGSSNTEELRLGYVNATAIGATCRAGSTQLNISITPLPTVGARVKLALRYKQLSAGVEVKLCADGVMSAPITLERLPTNFTTAGFSLGCRRQNSLSLPLNSTIEEFFYFPRAISDVELTTLTRT